MKKTLLVSALLLSATSAQAIESINWDQLTGSLTFVTFDDTDTSGISFGGSKLLTDNVFFIGNYEGTSGTYTNSGTDYDLTLSRLSFGAGYKHSYSLTTDFYGTLTYNSYGITLERYISGVTVSADSYSNGLGLTAGVRSLVTPEIELGASISRLSLTNEDSDETETDNVLSLSATYHFSDSFGLGLARTSFEDYTGIEIKGTWSF